MSNTPPYTMFTMFTVTIQYDVFASVKANNNNDFHHFYTYFIDRSKNILLPMAVK